MAVINTLGSSEVEVNENKDYVVDTVRTIRAAIEEGIDPGGGKTLLYCSTFLDEVAKNIKNMDQRIRVEIVQRMLRTLASTITMNVGEEEDMIVGEVNKEYLRNGTITLVQAVVRINVNSWRFPVEENELCLLLTAFEVQAQPSEDAFMKEYNNIVSHKYHLALPGNLVYLSFNVPKKLLGVRS